MFSVPFIQVFRMAKYRGMENEIETGDYFKFDNHIVMCYLAVSYLSHLPPLKEHLKFPADVNS